MSSDSTFLDAEDDERRQKRIGALLERLNTTSPSSSVSPNSLLNVGHERSPGPVEPPAELLARVQAFLPAISASNEALSQQNPEDVDIENVPEDEERYIEMVRPISFSPPRLAESRMAIWAPLLTKAFQNLGLGVFEAKRRHDPESGDRSPPFSDADSTSDVTSSESGSDSASSSNSEEESDSESDSSSSDADSDVESQSGSSVEMKPISSRPIKPLPRRVSQQAKLEV
ncbi:hypothetical protein OG21DRAFT_1493574 [Imleria badia]|nr:hypothetical protein OG21DRAFT_1493574 [Imleria badia]